MEGEGDRERGERDAGDVPGAGDRRQEPCVAVSYSAHRGGTWKDMPVIMGRAS